MVNPVAYLLNEIYVKYSDIKYNSIEPLRRQFM